MAKKSAKQPVKLDFTDVPQVVRDFLNYKLVIQGRSARTVEAYHIDLRLFFRYLHCRKYNNMNFTNLEDTNISTMTSEFVCSVSLTDAYEFISFALSKRDNNASTRARKISAIKALYKYMFTKTTLISENPMDQLEAPTPKKSLPKYLSLEQAVELLTTAETDGNPDSIRDYCILVLFLNCGMRLSELVGINIMDINLQRGDLLILGKGNKERIIYLNDACKAALTTYLPIRSRAKAKDPSALFLSRQNKRISPRRVEQIVSSYLKKAGLEEHGYSPHKLRHTAATLMYQHGDVDIRVLQLILGHAGLSTTQIYTHVSEAQLQQAANSSPLATMSVLKPKEPGTENEGIAFNESASYKSKE